MYHPALYESAIAYLAAIYLKGKRTVGGINGAYTVDKCHKAVYQLSLVTAANADALRRYIYGVVVLTYLKGLGVAYAEGQTVGARELKRGAVGAKALPKILYYGAVKAGVRGSRHLISKGEATLAAHSIYRLEYHN
jgi:hypothetical protein